MATVPHSVQMPTGGKFTIFAEPANINYFLRNALDADTVGGASEDQAAVPAHSRQAYPGDPAPVNVAASQREYLVDPSRKSGNALPGRQFVLARIGANGQVIEKRQFTYRGRWMDLHAFLSAEAAYNLQAFNHTGARYTIAATTQPGG